jgi:NADH-quinone oxidoreductase subunit H
MGMSVVPVFLIVGQLNLSAVVEYQALGLGHWMIFRQPLAFAIFVAAMFAETNRLPFDLPESEQELAGGYNVEYSSMKFALFFMGEYAAVTTASALLVTLFLGGWSLPIAGLNTPATTPLLGIMHIGIFLAKMLWVEFMIIWVRWMWPRFRYDQLMNLGWRRFIPMALANIIVTALVLALIDPRDEPSGSASRVAQTTTEAVR